MEKIKIKVNNIEYDFEKGVSLLEISKKVNTSSFPSLAGYIGNDMFSLDKKIEKDSEVKFVNVMDPVGNKIYQKGLVFLLVYAFKEVFGYKKKLKICHSIDKAIKVRTDLVLDEEKLAKIKSKMQDIVDKKMPIEKCLVRRKEAEKYFLSTLDNSKADTFKYNTNHYVTLYKLGDMYDYYFSLLPMDTGVFEDFDLHYLDGGSFVLQFPTMGAHGKIPPYIDRKKIVEAFDKNYRLSKRLGISNASELNEKVANGKISDIIKVCEVVASNELIHLAKDIESRRDKLKIVLIAGPSSSGKTTTSKKLGMYLKAFGFNPKPLSIDDYFLDREDTPKLPNGEYDFESIRAINTDLFNDHLTKLINGEEVSIPTFNFYKGKGEFLGNKIKLEENDILIIEGLHAINEKLTSSIEKDAKYKIYISPLTDLNIDDHNMVSNSDVRLLRRMIRDSRTRGYSAEDTISKWQNVRDGEEKYIFPFQNEVDFVFNSSLIYEIGVLKLFAEPLLFRIDNTSSCYEEVVRLLNFLDMFVSIPTDEVPNDSILREFIGRSYFER